MITSKSAAAIAAQTVREGNASSLYESAAVYVDRVLGLKFTKKWLRKQSDEEVEHQRLQLDFLSDFNCTTDVPARRGWPTKFEGPLDIFQTTLDTERGVSKALSAIVAGALSESDFQTADFIMRNFAAEQTDSEGVLQSLVDMLSEKGGDLLSFDLWMQEAFDL